MNEEVSISFYCIHVFIQNVNMHTLDWFVLYNKLDIFLERGHSCVVWFDEIVNGAGG